MTTPDPTAAQREERHIEVVRHLTSIEGRLETIAASSAAERAALLYRVEKVETREGINRDNIEKLVALKNRILGAGIVLGLLSGASGALVVRIFDATPI